MIGAVAVFVDTKSGLILPPGELEPVVKTSAAVSGRRLTEGIVTILLDHFAGKACQICDATKAVLLKEITLTVRHDDIIGSQQDFINPLAVEVPARAGSIGFPFVDGMQPIVGVIDCRSVEVSPDAPPQSIVSESIVVSAAVNVGKLTVAPIG